MLLKLLKYLEIHGEESVDKEEFQLQFYLRKEDDAASFKFLQELGEFQQIKEDTQEFLNLAIMLQAASLESNILTEFNHCPTRDNVFINICVAVVFSFTKEKVYEFVYNMGAEQLEEQMKASMDQAIRGLCRSRTHDQAYQIRNENCSDLKQSLNRIFQHVGINFKDVIIQDVKLPESIADDLQNKTLYDAVIDEQKKNQEYNVAVIKQNNDLQLIKQNKEQERLSYQQEFIKNQQDKQRLQKVIEAETHRQVANVEVKLDYETKQILFDSHSIATNLEGEKILETTIEISKATAINIAQINSYSMKTEMEAKSKVAQFQAQALKIQAGAEGKAAELLKAKRKWIEDIANLEVISRLSLNEDVLITGQGQQEGENSLNSLRSLYYMQKMGYTKT